MVSKVINEFIESSSLKKLSTISDVATILGVSVATFVAGPFLSEVTGLGFDASEFLWAIIFYFLAGCWVIYLVIETAKVVKVFLTKRSNSETESSKSNEDKILNLFGLIVMVALSVTFYSPIKNIYGDISNNRYLLPPAPSKAVNEVLNIEQEIVGKKVRLHGIVDFKEGFIPEQYVVTLYELDEESAEYNLYNRYSSERYTAINSKGEFAMAVDAKSVDKFKYIVIYRELDTSWKGPDFPTEISQIPSIEIEELGAFIYKL